MTHRANAAVLLLAAALLAAPGAGCRSRAFEVDLRNASDQTLGVQLDRNSGGRRQRDIRADLPPGASFTHRFNTQNRRTAAAVVVSAPSDAAVGPAAVPVEANRPAVYDLLIRDNAILPVPRPR
jgi:hypothetical protein